MREPMNHPCDQLEDFLAGDLEGRDRDDFELHLQECADCRSEVESQAYLNKLLTGAAAAFDRPPPELVNRVKENLDKAHRRFVAASVTVTVVVAGVLCGSGWLLLGGVGRQPASHYRQKQIVERQQETNGTPPDSRRQRQSDDRNDPSTAEKKVVVHFPDNVISQTLVGDNPNFTFIWVYPTEPFTPAEDQPE